ncbi:MAG: hypothetical protein ACD_4C00461G0001 [uncultured bacterium (gcode 4)]|uniref:Uncharacterized protein n=1 Tax=uncultured bacterium (gcode 4) TaxID=1234023 RepID=K2GRU5_9BACT|nr:MAG: hypothetical protein ACD_4C00461G0001 [uncultured bacterium (gcode 4)]
MKKGLTISAALLAWTLNFWEWNANENTNVTNLKEWNSKKVSELVNSNNLKTTDLIEEKKESVWQKLIEKIKNDKNFANNKILQNMSDEEMIKLSNWIDDLIKNDEEIRKALKNKDNPDFLYLYIFPLIIAVLYSYTYYSGWILNIIKKHNLADSRFYKYFFFLNWFACIRNGFQFWSLTYLAWTIWAFVSWRANEWLKEEVAAWRIISWWEKSMIDYLSSVDIDNICKLIEKTLENRKLSPEEIEKIIITYMANSTKN